MHLQNVWVLRGPNIWARVPVLEIEWDLAGAAAGDLAGLTDRLAGWLPQLKLQIFLSPSPIGGGELAHVLQHLTLALQSQAGSNVSFGLIRPTPRTGLYRVIVEYEEEKLARACLDAAREICLAALAGQPYDVPAKLHELSELAHEVRLGPSTGATVRAARQRNIPFRRLNEESLVQLGHGVHQRRILTAETDRTSVIAEAIAQDKQLTRMLLREVGVPVPEGRPVTDADDAWAAAQELGPPVVVKPQDGNHGRGVTTNLTTREQIVCAHAAAREESAHVVVERFAPGVDHRLLVVGGRLVAAALREPAQVVGDGRSTITELIAEVNKDPRRSDGHATVLSFIKLDAVGLTVLAEQGYTPDSVPPAGTRVLIRRNGNLSTGGTATDVTDLVHPEVAARAVDAARVVGLDIAGVDIVVADISLPLEGQGGVVVEVNAGPGLRMHLEPSAGKARPVGEAVVSMLFADGQTGRIPIVAVTGVNGKTTTTRLVAHLLHREGHQVGMTCSDGAYINGRRIAPKGAGAGTARALLLNPRVTAAVFETARGGILDEGLGFDQCDVALVTNIGGGDHLSLHGIETIKELARVKQTVVQAVAPAGTAVLNAADPLVVAMARHCPGATLYFAVDHHNAVLANHRAEGGRAVFVRDRAVVLAEGNEEQILGPLSQIPLTHQGNVAFQVENVLAAAAGAWSLGLPLERIRAGLSSFRGDVRQTPGRFNVLATDRGTVIVDYAHNPTALAALVEALANFPHRRRSLVFTGFIWHRRDVDVIRMGEIVGNGFDRVILYDDDSSCIDEAALASNRQFHQGLADGKRVAEVVKAPGELQAIETALETLDADDLLVLNVSSVDEALTLVQRILPNGSRAPEPAARSPCSRRERTAPAHS
jgi:cyanophycin synthetase